MAAPFRALAFAATLALGSGGGAFAGTPLDGADIRRLFAGVTLAGVYADGVAFRETYGEDGSIDYADDRGSDIGRWSVIGSAFCTFYDSLVGGCFAVEQESANCFTFYSIDLLLRQANTATAQGWDEARQTTCRAAEVAAAPSAANN